jgi:anaerobic magnesium-protoporphyrin IX monomethyl ester cyclase
MKKLDLALVGYEPKGNENLTLRLLAGAARSAGFRAELFLGFGVADARSIAERASAANPLMVGFSAQDAESAVNTLLIASMMRRAGYRGFIACGGPFATLQPDWILERSSAVDGIVKFDGERPVAHLLDALRRGIDLKTVPSLVTREWATTPFEGQRALHWRPVRGDRPTIMGVPTAAVIGSRGCSHGCGYCTHAAQSSLAVRECRSAGVSAETLRESGLGRPTRRPLDDLVGEMAELYHGDGVRFFQFIDEGFVPCEETAALAFLGEMKALYAARGIGRVALSFMTRGDALTPPVVDAMIDVGLFRTLVGVEAGSRRALEHLGREGDAGRGRRGLQMLIDGGVSAMFNALLLHPESTVASIREELDFLSATRGAIFETLQVRVFPGTRLHARLAAEERLRGGRILPSFSFRDAAIERFGTLLERLHREVFGRYTPAFRFHDLAVSAALADRLGVRCGAKGAVRELRDLGDDFNAVRVATVREMLDAAERGVNGDEALERCADALVPILRELDRIERDLSEGFGESPVSRQYRNLAAAAVFVFCLGAPTACHRVGSASGEEPAEVDTDSESGGAEVDAGIGVEGDAGIDTDTDTDTGDCASSEYDSQYGQLDELVRTSCGFEEHSPTVIVTLDESGAVVDVTVEASGGETEDWIAAAEECYLELLEGEAFPCLAGEEIWVYGFSGGPPMD